MPSKLLRTCKRDNYRAAFGTQEPLDSMKLHPRETCGDVIKRILENLRELNEETKKDIAKAIKEVKSGKYKTHKQVRKEGGF